MILHFEFDRWWFKVADDYCKPRRAFVYVVSVFCEGEKLFEKTFHFKKNIITLLTCDDILDIFEQALCNNEKRKRLHNKSSNDKSIFHMKNITRANKLKKILN